MPNQRCNYWEPVTVTENLPALNGNIKVYIQGWAKEWSLGLFSLVATHLADSL